MSKSGWYIYGAGDAGWMGEIAGPFETEKIATEVAKEWKSPKYEDEELVVEYSQGGVED